MLRKPPGRTPTDRQQIALKLLERARAGDPNVCAVWFSGGAGIQIKRNQHDFDPIPITWREAHRLAYPEHYVKPEVQRKPNARFQPTLNRRKMAAGE